MNTPTIDMSCRIEHFGILFPAILKVVDSDEIVRFGWNPEQCLLLASDMVGVASQPCSKARWGAVSVSAIDGSVDRAVVFAKPIVCVGDIVEIDPAGKRARLLFRRGANSNTLFATERCNSRCLMCSQPPRAVDDKWRVEQILTTIRLIDRDEKSIGLSGGEPTLLHDGLLEIIRACAEVLPHTELHILSNGRHLENKGFVRKISAIRHPQLTFGIPLYADIAALHDYTVQSAGAFDQTMRGLYNLAAADIDIEIRNVLCAPTVERLLDWGGFLHRKIPFATHVALMGLEPIGFALANGARLRIDPAEFSVELEQVCGFLHDVGFDVSIYNLPLCLLPRSLWGFSRRSISDWKQKYLQVCETCSVKAACCGYFSWAEGGWIPPGVRSVETEAA